MIKQTILLSTLLLFAPVLHGEESPLANLDIEKISETLGHLIVKQLDHPGINFNFDKVVQGIKDEKAGKPAPLSEEEYEQAVALIQEKIFHETAEQNLTDATSFLEKNAKTEGIISLNDKLQYQISEKGKGEKVGPESEPLIHYTGKLLDGTVFASSHESGDPISLPIKQTIPGFSEGLVGMVQGEKRTLYIHPELAYGVSGHLPPNSLLIFEVEVVEANPTTEEIAEKDNNS